MNIYSISVKDVTGNEVCLEKYRGKVLLIFNSAIYSTFTRQYRELEILYLRYQSSGLEILDFPSNDFHSEAPLSSSEIDSFVKENYHTTFPRFEKVNVIGENISPLFKYLISKKGFTGFKKGDQMTPYLSIYNFKKDPLYETKPDIKYNFTKFLVDKDGKVKKRFEANDSFDSIEKTLLRLLDR